MKLYHGSNVAVKNPKLITQTRALDFGAGFYLTSDYEQAAKWSRIITYRRRTGKASISIYEIDENEFNNLSILTFAKPDARWLSCISIHRNNGEYNKLYDIIIGPVADDNTMPVLNLYLMNCQVKCDTLILLRILQKAFSILNIF